MSWVLAALGFMVVIFAHELGHALMAVKLGMRLERFYVFFPPKIASFHIGETEVGIGIIPLGGMCKISGMSVLELEELPEEHHPRAYVNAPVWKRVCVIAAGPAVNVILAALIFFALSFARTEATTTVSHTAPGYPAATQLHNGDHIVAVDGHAVNPDNLAQYIDRHGCPRVGVKNCQPTAARILFRRNGQEQTIMITPKYNPQTKAPEIGVNLATGHQPTTVFQAVGFSATTMYQISDETVNALTQVFNARQRKQLSGVVGTYQATAQAFAFSFRVALLVLALISFSLALINLLPFLPLDGGHIYWALVEKLRGKPVPTISLQRSTFIGIVLILMLFAIGLQNDIGRLGTNLIGS